MPLPILGFDSYFSGAVLSAVKRTMIFEELWPPSLVPKRGYHCVFELSNTHRRGRHHEASGDINPMITLLPNHYPSPEPHGSHWDPPKLFWTSSSSRGSATYDEDPYVTSHDFCFCVGSLLYTDKRQRTRTRHTTPRIGNSMETENENPTVLRLTPRIEAEPSTAPPETVHNTTTVRNSPPSRQLVGAGINLTPGSPLISPSLSWKVSHGR